MAIKKELRGRDKAAILLVILGPEVASQVYKHLDEATIELLSDPAAQARIAEAEVDIATGDVTGEEELRALMGERRRSGE